jgi:hypothetical protein
MNCHLDHDIFEMFDKRHFKCDCGTPKSGMETLFVSYIQGCICKLKEQQTDDNNENEYNHNFEHKYCWCNGSYKPDDIMFQCIMCMDWFHMDCIQKKVYYLSFISHNSRKLTQFQTLIFQVISYALTASLRIRSCIIIIQRWQLQR